MSKTSKKNSKIKVTLSIDKDVYRAFQKYCEDHDLMLSKRIERKMKEEMEK
jgi:hypothetical protein